MAEDATALSVRSGGVTLSGEETGEGLRPPAFVLLHGLTATRRYVVMGSRLLERSGHRVVAYDARGHGLSSPAEDREAYGYELLAGDLGAVLDALEIERAILAGASMGAHTAARFALSHPERVAALCLITPAYDPSTENGADAFAGWDALARGLREDGVEGFLRAYHLDAVPATMRDTVEKVIRQRLSAHAHPEAIADALEAVPRSRPFERMDELAAISAPTLVVGSRDEADPGHPLAVGERYAGAIPQAELLVEVAGPPLHSPIAWQGGQLSRALLELARCAGHDIV
jgi:pimeloyl-ACP methyl ester carboxylesterase